MMRVKGPLISTILGGKVKRKIGAGTHARQWMDDLREWAGLSQDEMWREPQCLEEVCQFGCSNRMGNLGCKMSQSVAS